MALKLKLYLDPPDIKFFFFLGESPSIKFLNVKVGQRLDKNIEVDRGKDQIPKITKVWASGPVGHN